MVVTTQMIFELGQRARAAASLAASLDTPAKNRILKVAADRLLEATDHLLNANARDVEGAADAGMAPTLIDRLRLDANKIESMSSSLGQIADLPDPVGTIVDSWTRPNGLRFERARVPLGVVGIIYESRPNVTSDAFGLCLKAGNVSFLRGSSAAFFSNQAIVGLLRNSLSEREVSPDLVLLVEDGGRDTAIEFMGQRGIIDCLIPRGGPSLIESVLEHATVPYIIDGDGNCHVYVDDSADLEMATKIIVNAKTQRPSVCNAAESLVVHSAVAAELLPTLAEALENVELVGDERARALVPRMGIAAEDDWSKEYLDLKLSVRVVDDLDEAITHVNETGTGHSEAIVTSDPVAARRFTTEVDAAAVLVNASTRFIDGEEFGFGAEIGISTQKLHARGPLGLQQLTTEKFLVHGDGQVRT